MGYVINSAICVPENNEHILLSKENAEIELKGFAIGDGESGASITKVEISLDEGKTWHQAILVEKENKDKESKVFTWTLWNYKVKVEGKLNDQENKIKARVRAFDSTGHKQEAKLQELYNIRGLLNNSPHEITVSYSFRE